MQAPLITKVIERIQACDLKDLDEHAAIRDELNELRELLQRISSTLAGCVDAAVTLTRHLPQVTPSAGVEVKQIICRLVTLVSDVLPKIQKVEAPPKTPDSPDRMRTLKPRETETANDSLRLINDMLLGEILVQLGVLDHEKVDAAIKTQKATSMRFGEALVHLGAASWKDVEHGLRLQEHLSRSRMSQAGPTRLEALSAKERPPVSAFGSEHLNVLNDMMLGEEMIRLGMITREQLKKALGVQNAAGIRIGQALVEIGAATWDQVAEGVRMQERHRDQGGGRQTLSASG